MGGTPKALCEAMSRPTMQFVPVKTEEQQAALMLAGVRAAVDRRRTQLGNAIRGYAAEFGLTTAKGLDKIEPLLAEIAAGREHCRSWRASCSRFTGRSTRDCRAS